MLQAKIKTSFQISYTSVQDAFVDEYMSADNAIFSLIYIALYRHVTNSQAEVLISEIAQGLGVNEAEVFSALEYWREKRILDYITDGTIVKINFSLIIPNSKVVKEEIPQIKANVDNSVSLKPALITEARPTYPVEELEIYQKECSQIRDLFVMTQQVLGKTLAYNDMNTIFSLYDWLGMSVGLIETLLNYCAENDHRNMHYIEKVAMDWAENEITTTEDANEYLKLYNVDFRQIMKAYGHGRRNPSKTEIKYMNRWLKEYNFALEIILDACDKTIMQINEPKFSYTEKILKTWSVAGVKTIDEIKQLELDFAQQKAEKDTDTAGKTHEKSKPKPRVNRFGNFPQRVWNFEELEKLERQNLLDNANNN